MNPKDKIHDSWKFITNILDNDEKLNELNTQVLTKCTWYPKPMDIFNVFQMPLNDVKVVILGQDPYPNEGRAIGYAFAINENVNKPVSLRIIEKELNSPIDRTLLKWREQGVFLLNTALTVEAKKAGSHLKYWEEFTKKVVNSISVFTDAIFILWGKKAQAYKPYCIKNEVLEAPHPAAEAYSGGKAGFYGCNHFNLVNEILQSQGKETINW